VLPTHFLFSLTAAQRKLRHLSNILSQINPFSPTTQFRERCECLQKALRSNADRDAVYEQTVYLNKNTAHEICDLWPASERPRADIAGKLRIHLLFGYQTTLITWI
jgi:hypothetical protein